MSGNRALGPLCQDLLRLLSRGGMMARNASQQSIRDFSGLRPFARRSHTSPAAGS
jgi:hypothetical protein